MLTGKGLSSCYNFDFNNFTNFLSTKWSYDPFSQVLLTEDSRTLQLTTSLTLIFAGQSDVFLATQSDINFTLKKITSLFIRQKFGFSVVRIPPDPC